MRFEVKEFNSGIAWTQNMMNNQIKIEILYLLHIYGPKLKIMMMTIFKEM